ncbi:Oxysterol-binding protein OBPa [Entomophthora muscae]|uniref:Oxysterol-binding protein OBPa n=1 Tax=Entomophthora muscae TaxID=34485 RepID=A0ACC2U8V0_9FUNG|nr:Oxysterol-binding protein OBPa [Entomophthora muscae]
MRPKSKFYGTSAATHLEGTASIKFLNHPGEEYIITYPSIYVYGVLFGKLTYDLGDSATITCEKTDLSCRAEFKTKGIFSGSYNSISGKIKKTSTGETLYDFSGKWSEKIYVKGKSGPESIFFDALTAQQHPKDVAPEDAQDPFESRRLWRNVTENLKNKNIDAATEEKNIIEQDQRDETRVREETGTKYNHRFFDVTESGSTWKLKNLSDDPLKAKVEIDNFIFKYDPTATI